jgi:hypothetical protein
MASAPDRPEPTQRQLADLSALADGSLDPARREAVEAEIARSSELSARYEREQRVVAVLHEARATDRAPAALRARIEAQRPSRRARSGRRLVYGGSLAAGLAALALAAVLILPAGTPGAPSVSQAAGLAVLGANSPAPAGDPTAPGLKLGQAVDDVYFPDWSQRFGWRAIGQRTDRINGRVAVTVYYEWQGKRLAYTIVGAPALATPAASVRQLNGTELRTLTLGKRLVVTWRRDGHTCVLSGSGVPAGELQKLAAWNVPESGH